MKSKNRAKPYAHFEGPSAASKSDDGLTGGADDNSPVNGPPSSGNNSDSPSD